MTLERAAELVSKLQGTAKIDLFCHFDDIFRLSERDPEGNLITMFAAMCGFGTVTSARIK